MINHPYFTPVVVFVVALVLGIYLQLHFNVIPNLEVHVGDNKNDPHNQHTHPDPVIDTSSWNQWQKVRHWPDEGAAWPTPRVAHAACVARNDDDDMMYIFGGQRGGTTEETSPAIVLSDFYMYDEFHDRFHEIHTAASSSPAARFDHSLSYDKKGKQLILFGGLNDNNEAHADGFWIFSIKEKKWKNILPMMSNSPSKKVSSRHKAAVVTINDISTLVVLGGDQHDASMIYSFNLKTLKWNVPLKSSPTATANNLIINLVKTSENQLYLATTNKNSNQKTIEEWILEFPASSSSSSSSPIWNRLETTGSIPTSRRSAAIDVLPGIKNEGNQFIFLFGGVVEQGGDEKLLDDFYVLSLNEKVWEKIERGSYGLQTRPPPTVGHTLLKLRDKIVLFGGRTSTIESVGSSEVWEFLYSGF